MELGFLIEKISFLTEKHLSRLVKWKLLSLTIPYRKVRNLMVQHNSLSEKGQERISAVFSTLQIGQLFAKPAFPSRSDCPVLPSFD